MNDDDFNTRINTMVECGLIMHVFDVNEDGEADGEPCNGALIPDFVEAGYGLNRPCVIRYPDGRLEIGNRVAFTPAGVEYLRREMEAGSDPTA